LDGFQDSLNKEIAANNEEAPMWFKTNPVIELDEQVIHSSKIDAYRNKVEFTIGRKYDLEK
jgi:hypothetical protein